MYFLLELISFNSSLKLKKCEKTGKIFLLRFFIRHFKQIFSIYLKKKHTKLFFPKSVKNNNIKMAIVLYKIFNKTGIKQNKKKENNTFDYNKNCMYQ